MQVFKVVVFSLCLCYTGVSLCRVQKVVSKVVVFPQCVAGCWLLVCLCSIHSFAPAVGGLLLAKPEMSHFFQYFMQMTIRHAEDLLGN